MKKKEIFFKASRRNSSSYSAYRQILKRGDLDIDMMSGSDDVIILNVSDLKGTLHIDCNKKTGEFRLFI